MGKQANLNWMLNAPMEVTCPKCGRTIETRFDDYDIDGDPLEQGQWRLHTWCEDCDMAVKVEAHINPKWEIKPGE